MKKTLGMLLLLVGASTCAMATVSPEIDPASAGSAVALVSGAILIIRSRKK